jgi:hypothetical protein
VYSHPGHRSTSIPEDKTSFLPIVVANIISKSEAGIFGTAPVNMLFDFNVRKLVPVFRIFLLPYLKISYSQAHLV